MSEIEWADSAPDGREKYPAKLDAIKAAQLANPERRDSWAFLTEFEVETSARDLAARLTRKYDEFEFVSRKGQGTTVVYARLREGVDA